MSLKTIEKQGLTKVKIPKRAQDIVPVLDICRENGIFRIDKEMYSMTYEIKDVDYFNLDEEDQKDIYYSYSDVLNSLSGTKCNYKISIVKNRRDLRDIKRQRTIRLLNDRFDNLRKAYNELTTNDLNAAVLDKRKYITATVNKKNIQKASATLNRTALDLNKRFQKFGSSISLLTADDRLKILYNFFNSGKETQYIPLSLMCDADKDFRSMFCPAGIKFHNDYFEINNRVGRVFFIRNWSKNIKDDFLNELTKIEDNLILSLDIIALTAQEIEKLLEDKDSDVESSVINWSNTKNAKENRAATLPRRLKKNRKVLNEYVEDVHERNQKIFLAQGLMVVLADDMMKLEEYTESINETASEFTFTVETLWFQQCEGLIDCLPVGWRTIDNMVDKNTETLAMMIPFEALRVNHESGIPYGKQLSTGEQVYIDRRLLRNGNEIIVGTSGAGKSQNAKLKAFYYALLTGGDIIFVDPDGEDSDIVRAMGGSIIRVGHDSLNAFDMFDGYGFGEDPVKEKSNFIITLIERIIDNDNYFDEEKKSIVDRCVMEVCRNMSTRTQTLLDFYCVLSEQKEHAAEQLTVALERHIIGSFNVFAKPTSVNLQKRIQCFDLSALDSQIKNSGMLICMDFIKNILAMNRHKQIATYIFFDELDVYLKHPASCAQLETFFQRSRKYGGFCTGIIQNITKLFDIPQASTMIKNSENLIMMGQAEDDAEVLARMFKLSDLDKEYLISGCKPGEGINKIGHNIFRFDGKIPKDNLIYSFVNTDGHSITS